MAQSTGRYDLRRYVKGDIWGKFARVIVVNLPLETVVHIKNHMNARRHSVGEFACVYGIISVGRRTERRGIVF